MARVGRAVTDSRQVHAGDVFWGLAGTRFDGAEFAAEAYARGAAGVVVGTQVRAAVARLLEPGSRRRRGGPAQAGRLESAVA